MYQILIVDDDRVHATMLQRYLEMLGHSATVAANGLEALDGLGGHDLVLMDVNMPEMDGLEATRKIREKEASKGGHVPILAITAHTGDDCDECMEAGMDAMLPKPVFLAKLVAVINEHIPGAKQEMPD